MEQLCFFVGFLVIQNSEVSVQNKVERLKNIREINERVYFLNDAMIAMTMKTETS